MAQYATSKLFHRQTCWKMKLEVASLHNFRISMHTLLRARLVGDHHFNAAEQLCAILHSRRILCGYYTSQEGTKEVVVLSNDGGNAKLQLERAAMDCCLRVSCSMEDIEFLSYTLANIIACTFVILELRQAGCTVIGKADEMSFAVVDQFSAGAVPAIRLQEMYLGSDKTRAVMYLSANALLWEIHTLSSTKAGPPQCSVDKREEQQVYALPRMGSCRVIRSITVGELMKTRTLSLKYGYETYIPRDEKGFRDYWFLVHGIRIPSGPLEYAVVRFSSGNEMLYPTCCLATTCCILHGESHRQAGEIIAKFKALLSTKFEINYVRTAPAHERFTT